MILGGLDIATATGVCIGEPGAKPKFFTRDLGAGKSHDYRFAQALKLARYLIAEEGVQAIGIEDSVQAKHHKKSQNDLLGGMIACVQGWAHIKGVKTCKFAPSVIDMRFLGYSPKTRAERKPAIVKQCQVFGWNPQTQDEADAGSVWESMCVELSPAYAAASGTLLRGRVA